MKKGYAAIALAGICLLTSCGSNAEQALGNVNFAADEASSMDDSYSYNGDYKTDYERAEGDKTRY